MGLDMYLNKRIYVGAEFKHRKVTGKIKIEADGKPIKVNFERVSEIIERVAYWRKANQIHAWFVKNCQNGVDDCRESYVSEENLKQLLDECKKAKNSKEDAQELLPPQSGFFFGGTEMDDYYYQDLDYTIKTIQEILKENEKNPGDYYYRSSW
jgi:hypothetical protein